MYIRSFQPADVSTNRLWFGRTLLHIAGFIAAIGLTMYLVLDFVHMAQAGILSGYVRKDALAIAGAIIAYIGLNLLTRTRGAVDFGETNAIDVESMGLYWHFVDIVWIVIFTVVYLLEYI
jgi:cytochrome o ubiquinol oxidase subunit 3